MSEKSITIGLLGANHEITKLVGEAFGSPATKSDLQFYNRLDSSLNLIFTAVAPIAYPEKIKSLIQTCAETKIHIMIIDAEIGISSEIGEIMVIMDFFAQYFKTRFLAVIGGITTSNEIPSQVDTSLSVNSSLFKLLNSRLGGLNNSPEYELIEIKN